MAQQSPSKRVLVVDDNREAADVLSEMLSLCGYAAKAVYDGRSALAAAEDFQPAMFVLDIGMPGMNGLQLAAALRRQAQFANTRLVAFTAWGDAHMRELTKKAGFDAHLVKPASLEDILNALSASDTPSALIGSGMRCA